MDSELENGGITALTFQQLKEMTDDFSDNRLVGEGTFGDVYKGVHRNGEVIAVKLLRSMLPNDMLMKNEINRLGRLEHQNILRLVAFCEETENVLVEYKGKMIAAEKIHQALCYPYYSNGSLQNYISDESHGLEWPTRYRIIKGTCKGLKHLHHSAHVLHLDIKPDNILLDDNMEPKLADFGLSRFISGDRTVRTISALGTMGYMPPEYIIRQLISTKFDIYSLGVVMIKIVAGSEAYMSSIDMTTGEFIDVVRANWRRRLQSTFRGPTLDAYCEQVKRCIEIAEDCVKEHRNERPDIEDITLTLKQTETHKGFEHLHVWKMSFQELKNITNNFKEEIGKGTFGIVYKGKLANGEPVAVKRLNHHSANQRKQIESEEHLKNIEHKNIVRLVGFCHETRPEPVRDARNPGTYIFADVTESLLCYELLNGTLEDKMWKNESCTLDWQTRYSVIQGICEGLHYLHKQCHNAPIVHRDLKASNVLLDDDMVPKLGDFGLSRIVPKTKAHLTAAVGSCGYMAPETIRDTRASEITPKSDIYSLGVLILEIVTGKKCDDDDKSGRKYIEEVRREQNSYVASFQDCFLEQVKNWISIGLRCTHRHSEMRPSIEQITHFLETESDKSADTRQGKVTKMSFKELEDATNKFSGKPGESIFGAVYKGTRVNGDDIVVIKLKEHMRLSPADFEGEVNRMNFKNENILQLKGYCAEQRLICYESFKGRLGAKIYGDLTQLRWEARYKIIEGICLALKYLHEECNEDAPQVHMGITPANIWLDDQEVPKLGACGVSRLFARAQTQIYNEDIVESRGYVAPEHVELTKMTTKSDIYSLGVLIVEIVTGQKCSPIDNGSVTSLIANVHKTWMKDSHVSSKYTSLDAEGLQQVKGCIKVGVQCADTSPDKRPTAGEIILMLKKECTSKPGCWNALCAKVCP